MTSQRATTSIEASIEQAIARNEPTSRIMATLHVDYETVAMRREVMDKAAASDGADGLVQVLAVPPPGRCGSSAGARRHYRRREPLCFPCLRAAREYQQNRRTQARKEAS